MNRTRDMESRNGWHEVHRAAEVGDAKELRRLLAEDPRLAHKTTPHGSTLLHTIAISRPRETGDHPACLRVVLKFNPSTEGTDDAGNTAFHNAAMAGVVDRLEALAKEGADPTAVNRHGEKPIDLVEDRNSEAYRYLLDLTKKRLGNGRKNGRH